MKFNNNVALDLQIFSLLIISQCTMHEYPNLLTTSEAQITFHLMYRRWKSSDQTPFFFLCGLNLEGEECSNSQSFPTTIVKRSHKFWVWDFLSVTWHKYSCPILLATHISMFSVTDSNRKTYTNWFTFLYINFRSPSQSHFTFKWSSFFTCMFFLNSIHLRSVLLLLLLQAFFQNTTSFPSLSLYPEGSQLSAKFSLQMAFFSLCYFIIAGVWTSSSSQLQFGLSLHSSDLSFPHLHWAAPFFGLLKLWFGFKVSSSLYFPMRRSLLSSISVSQYLYTVRFESGIACHPFYYCGFLIPSTIITAKASQIPSRL